MTIELTYANAVIEAAKIADGLMVAGITENGTFIMVEGCRTAYDFDSDYGVLLGPRMVNVLDATLAEIESSRKLEADRIRNENRKPARQYRRRY